MKEKEKEFIEVADWNEWQRKRNASDTVRQISRKILRSRLPHKHAMERVWFAEACDSSSLNELEQRIAKKKAQLRMK